MLKHTKAWQITTKNASTLSHISGRDEMTILSNIGWILVEVWSPFHQFFILPPSYFKGNYPNVPLEILKVDE